MNAEQTAQEASFEVAHFPPQLWDAHFSLHGIDDLDEAVLAGPLPFRYHLQFASQHRQHLMVSLSLHVEGVDWLTLRATYRMAFEIRGQITDELLRLLLRDLAGRIGPATLYPYVRETLSSLAQKSSLPPVALPLVDFSRRVNTETLDVPISDIPPPPEIITLRTTSEADVGTDEG